MAVEATVFEKFMAACNKTKALNKACLGVAAWTKNDGSK
jgi:hypothetical protein